MCNNTWLKSIEYEYATDKTQDKEGKRREEGRMNTKRRGGRGMEEENKGRSTLDFKMVMIGLGSSSPMKINPKSGVGIKF